MGEQSERGAMFDRTTCGWLRPLSGASIKYFLPLAVLPVIVHFLLNYKFVYPPPLIEEDGYFGSGETRADDVAVEPFAISVENAVLDDLNFRLTLSTLRGFPQEEEDQKPNFLRGLNFAYLKNVTDAISNFNWKQHEYFINTFQHFKTEIEGLQIHFIRAKPAEKTYEKVVPILLIHDWTSSFWEFYKIIPILSNPARFGFEFGTKGRIAFDVVVPSLPGFAWSETPMKSGLGDIECARIFDKLMRRLYLITFYVHGSGNLGGEIASAIAALHRSDIRGLHLANVHIRPFTFPQIFVKQVFDFLSTKISLRTSTGQKSMSSYFVDLIQDHMQLQLASTTPEVIGAILRESPVALSSWILNEWTSASQCDQGDGGLSQRFTLDEILTNILIYWVTDSVHSATRFLHYSKHHPLHSEMLRATIFPPTAIANSPRRTVQSSIDNFQYRYRDIRRFTLLRKGGENVAALEQAREIAEEIFAFVELIEG